MDAGPSGEVVKSAHITWTSSMSTMMLEHLTSIVAASTRTSSGFKKVHPNACDRALNEHFNFRLNFDHINNHVRTWKRKYAKINELKKIGGAIWDEDNFMITLEHDHYTKYIQDHKTDAEYLNKLIEHYAKMLAIFGNSQATEKYAKGSNESLSTDVLEVGDEGDENDVAATTHGTNGVAGTNEDNAATSSASKPKRAKTSAIVATKEDGLVAAMTAAGERLARAILQVAKGNNELPENLFESVHEIPGFEETHLSHYHAHLVENPRIARVFVTLPFSHKVTSVARYVSDTFQE